MLVLVQLLLQVLVCQDSTLQEDLLNVSNVQLVQNVLILSQTQLLVEPENSLWLDG